jgi:V/A-type H+/Na+-transporting ATPase subunit E
MALEDILRKIIEEAQAQAGEILQAAEADRQRVLGEGSTRAQAAAAKIEAAGRAAAEEARRKALSGASVEARRLVLSTKQELLTQVFEQAVQRLVDMPDAQYRALLADLAARAAQSGTESVIVSDQDRSRLGEEFLVLANQRLAERGLPGQLSFSPDVRPLRGGLILGSGDIESNCSFERTLASLRDDLEPEVASMLFAAQVDGP